MDGGSGHETYRSSISWSIQPHAKETALGSSNTDGREHKDVPTVQSGWVVVPG